MTVEPWRGGGISWSVVVVLQYLRRLAGWLVEVRWPRRADVGKTLYVGLPRNQHPAQHYSDKPTRIVATKPHNDNDPTN